MSIFSPVLRRAGCTTALVAATVLACMPPASAGIPEAVSAFDRGDHAKGFAEIQPLAEGGDARAQYLYGAMVESGKIKVAGADPIEWYRRAAEQGDIKAKYAYARLVISDIPGQEKVPERAMAWLEEAAAQGHAPAGHLLGAVLLAEAETGEVLRRAMDVYSRMADAGDAEAMVELGKILSGWMVSASQLEQAGVKDADKEAFTWFQRAATALEPSARIYLARAYETGRGITRDDQLAFDWYLIAARHDDPAAQYKVASLYQLGDGVVRQDRKAAFGWTLRAAEQGLRPAMLNTGLAYAYGSGVKKDLTKGYYWLSLALREGERGAERHLRSVGTQLGAGKRAALDKQVAAWTARDGEAVKLALERLQARSIGD